MKFAAAKRVAINEAVAVSSAIQRAADGERPPVNSATNAPRNERPMVQGSAFMAKAIAAKRHKKRSGEGKFDWFSGTPTTVFEKAGLGSGFDTASCVTDGVTRVTPLLRCHCEERSDEAIHPIFELDCRGR